jgi:uncharacterized membrane protein YeaQ/YmgE (transglycosylase-associated protein family)
MTEPVLPQWTPPPPVYGYAYPVRPTNGLAIASMIVAIVGFAGLCAYGVGSIFISPVGAILGHVARRQIRERDQQGEGMALAGIIVGWVGFALGLVVAAVFAAFVWFVAHAGP